VESTEKEPIRDVDENSIISLSTIVNTLQDFNNGTPRRLVDQLLMAQKKKKNNTIIQDDTRKETYTLPSDKKSVLAMSTRNTNKYDDINVDNRSVKLSIDSQIKNKTKDEIVDLKQERTRVSFAPIKNVKEAESFTNVSKKNMSKKDACNEDSISLFNQDVGK
jgi:hypothetical protein